MNDQQKFRQEVIVTDFDIPFGSMVKLLVKLALAAIPAMIILAMVGGLIFAVLAALFGGHSSQ
jgi:hypothetical protein